MYCNKESVNILTALLVDYGVRHVVVCPGSRNAPIVHNFNECPEIECHPVTDERSAAFVALGINLQVGEPVVVCVTSGSALLNTLPAVAEAKYQHRQLIVISADRPECWIDQLDGQTIPQPDALGSFVARSVSLPECKDEAERWYCRRLVCEAMIDMLRTKSPVHINVPITEPLFSFSVQELPSVKAVEPLMWNSEIGQQTVLQFFAESQRPMIVIGQMGRYEMPSEVVLGIANNITTIAEPLSVDDPVLSLDALMKEIEGREEQYRPDLLLYLGGNTVSKRLRQFLRTVDDNCKVVMCSDELKLQDPTQHAQYLLVGNPTQVLYDLSDALAENEPGEFYHLWDELIAHGDELQMVEPECLEAKAVQTLETMLDENSIVHYANSSSVRYASRYAYHFVHCNRGVNGIEGSLSTAVGASLVTEEKVFCVIGDLSFFYDQNALWNQHLGGNLRILLLNNNRGEIFSQIPGLENSPAFNNFVAASHKNTAVGACHEYGVSRRMVSKAEDLAEGISWLVDSESNCPLLLEVLIK